MPEGLVLRAEENSKAQGSRIVAHLGNPAGLRVKLIIRMAQENAGWGCNRIAGALANLGHEASEQTIGHILKRHGIAPGP